jgi:hypothetical protein
VVLLVQRPIIRPKASLKLLVTVYCHVLGMLLYGSRIVLVGEVVEFRYRGLEEEELKVRLLPEAPSNVSTVSTGKRRPFPAATY